MTIDVVNSENKKVGSVDLKDELFGKRVKSDLIWEAVVHEQPDALPGRHPVADQKRRDPLDLAAEFGVGEGMSRAHVGDRGAR